MYVLVRGKVTESGLSQKNNGCVKDISFSGKSISLLAALCVVSIFKLMQPKSVFAAGQLTDLFDTVAFSGSWKVIEKLNWVGMLIQGIISVFCFIGLALLVIRIITTLLYLSNRNLFDAVYDLKQQGKGSKVFGFGPMFKDIFNGNQGVGGDAVLGFFMSLIPNIKNYSDYNPERMRYNLQEDDTILLYVLKTALPYIMSMFFFTIGWSGVLWNCYGAVVDAMAYAAERASNESLVPFVERALGKGQSYSFTFDGDDTEFGSFRQKLAKSMYSKVLRKTSDLNTDTQIAIGGAIDNWISKNITVSVLDGKCNTQIAQSDKDAKNLTYSVVINTSASYDINNGFYASVSASDLALQAGDTGEKLYVHVFITKKKNSEEVNYFQMKESGNGSSSSGDQQGPTQIQK